MGKGSRDREGTTEVGARGGTAGRDKEGVAVVGKTREKGEEGTGDGEIKCARGERRKKVREEQNQRTDKRGTTEDGTGEGHLKAGQEGH